MNMLNEPGLIASETTSPSNLLTGNLPLLAGAPNGVQKLRKLILELAVRGKLVPQDPSDEPASELLKKIIKENSQSLKRGAANERTLPAAIDEAAFPYETASNWLWIKLGDIALIERGGSPRPIKDYLTESPDGLNWIKISDTDKGGKYITSSREKIRREGLAKTRMVYPGDFLLTNSMSFGRPYITQIAGCIHDGWLRISPPSLLVKDYLYLLLSSPYVYGFFVQAAAGAVVLNLNADKVRELPVPIPPLAEQHRIVAKVDELMALCDRLEAQQADAESAHARLVQALLDSLTQASDADDFAASWKRLAEHFHTLFTTESSIDALKQALLQLAVMGKLVPQDPSDEPAAELLKHIAKKKAQLITEGKIKKQKPLVEISQEEKPFNLPKGWEWARFGNICSISSELVRPEDFPELRQVAPDCIEKGTGLLTERRTVKESGVKGPNNRFYAGQIIYSKIRPSLSKAVLVDFEGLCSADMYPLDVFIDPQFLLNEILSEVFLRQVRIAENRIKMPKLNKESLASFVLPIPPLLEQHRIVNKIYQIVTLCNQLKGHIRLVQQVQVRLTNALVEQAVA
ncbi:hypothetical protein HMPREF1487_09598 [Pseudomonas sp. HPB0071]|uniref:restriction endonuclease subunit S n=1 Tax=unclassified Pseudomonas TaxID=196821 RepID=UPI0002CABE99|nr:MULTISPECIES: restriction endonuclease subunit S [unclassified Pseudomonas]ENA26557.1 hypothetical protein HMPREF1487_09598 [Pseudomonas sp. HPB0071]